MEFALEFDLHDASMCVSHDPCHAEGRGSLFINWSGNELNAVDPIEEVRTHAQPLTADQLKALRPNPPLGTDPYRRFAFLRGLVYSHSLVCSRRLFLFSRYWNIDFSVGVLLIFLFLIQSLMEGALQAFGGF